MTPNNPWAAYQQIDIEEPQVPSQEAVSPWAAYKAVDIQEGPQRTGSIGEGVVEGFKGVGRIAGRGASSLLAAPSKGIGGLLEFISQFGVEGEPGQIKGMGTRALRDLGQYLQKIGKEGQAQLNQELENLLGTSYTPVEEFIAGTTERAADLYGRGPFKGMGASAALGGVAGETAKALGAPEEVQALAEIGGFGAKDIAKAAKSLVPEKIVEKSGLVLPKIVEKTKEGFRRITPKAFQGSKDKAYQKVSDQAEKIIKEIKEKSLPMSVEIEKGIDVEGKLSKQLQDVENIAKELPYQIESNYVSEYLDKIEEGIRKAPVPTEEQEQILKLVDKFRKQYGQVEGGVRLYSPSQYVNQYRNLNKDARKLYETKLLQGQQLETIGFYEGLKDGIVKTLEEGTPESFSKLFKQTNADYAQLANLNKFENLMANISKDGALDATKLGSIFKSPSKSKALRRQLGKEGFDRLRLIADDLEKVKDSLKMIKEIGLSEFVKSAGTYGLLTKLGIPFAAPLQVGKKAIDVGAGYMLLNDRGFRDTQNLLRAIQSGSKKSIETYLRNLDKHMQEYEETLVYPYEDGNNSAQNGRDASAKGAS